jgi:hypothetical protein
LDKPNNNVSFYILRPFFFFFFFFTAQLWRIDVVFLFFYSRHGCSITIRSG